MNEDTIKKLHDLDSIMKSIEDNVSTNGQEMSGVEVHCEFIKWGKLYREYRTALNELDDYQNKISRECLENG